MYIPIPGVTGVPIDNGVPGRLAVLSVLLLAGNPGKPCGGFIPAIPKNTQWRCYGFLF